jgi:hypothetical protein
MSNPSHALDLTFPFVTLTPARESSLLLRAYLIRLGLPG